MIVWLRFWTGGGRQLFMNLDDHSYSFCIFTLYDNCIVDDRMSYGTMSNLHLFVVSKQSNIILYKYAQDGN
jgi:hypothetical protein